MATLNFPPSDQSPFEAPNGVTYVWNTDGYWEASGDSLNDIYLSSTVDDTAAGEITFEGQTTHEAGINATQVKGFSNDTNIDLSNASSSVRITNDGWNATVGSGNQARNLNVTWQSTEVLDSSFTSAYNISSILLNPVSSTADVTSFWATANNQNTSGTVAAFRTGVNANANAGTGLAYAFYAGSDAPSYFGGETYFISNDKTAIEAGSKTGCYINNNGVRVSSRAQTSAANHLSFRNSNGTIGAIGTKDSDLRFENLGTGLLKFIVNGTEGLQVREDSILSLPVYNKTNSNSTNMLRVTSAGLFQRSTSSRRYKNNIRDCAMFDGTASDSVKQLQPRTWEDYESGETVCGFIAEELYELGGEHMVSFSPWSFQTDEGVEYRTGNGETPVTKDAVPMSDDVEVVDGINDRALTILLTKALQEALTEIDTLKTRLNDAGIA